MNAKTDNERVKHQQECGADKAEFFGKRGENKVGVFFGHEVKPRLRSLHEAAPVKPARTERDFGLADVIARAKRVQIRVQKGFDTPILIVFQQLPACAP